MVWLQGRLTKEEAHKVCSCGRTSCFERGQHQDDRDAQVTGGGSIAEHVTLVEKAGAPARGRRHQRRSRAKAARGLHSAHERAVSDGRSVGERFSDHRAGMAATLFLDGSNTHPGHQHLPKTPTPKSDCYQHQLSLCLSLEPSTAGKGVGQGLLAGPAHARDD